MSNRDPLSDESLYKNPLQEHYRRSFPKQKNHTNNTSEGEQTNTSSQRKPDDPIIAEDLEQQKTTARGLSITYQGMAEIPVFRRVIHPGYVRYGST